MSLKLRIIKFMMKRQESAFNETIDIDKLRASGKSSAAMPAEKNVTIKEMKLGGVPCEFVEPPEPRNDVVILYVHGGGFISGSCTYFRSFTSYFAKESKIKIYGIDYRLAPEHPFPAATDDCFNAYKSLLEIEKGKSIILLGESAGANLILTIYLQAKQNNLPLPLGIIAYSPLTDATGKIDYSTNAKTDFVLGKLTAKTITDLYAPGADTSLPLISPYYGDFKGCPPIRLVWDSGEILCPDNKRFASKLSNEKVQIETKEWDHTFHTFEILAKMMPESKKEINYSIQFINTLTTRT
ncbi:MAG: alpha/beta hydrolase [Lachnospiraceae bacterium]